MFHSRGTSSTRVSAAYLTMNRRIFFENLQSAQTDCQRAVVGVPVLTRVVRAASVCASKLAGGTSMSLDISTLYLVATMVAAMLGAMLLFFGRQENIPALKWWGTAYLLGAASVALWTLAGSMLEARFGGMLSLALNAVGFLACGMVWNASRVFHGRKPNSAGAGAGRDRLDRRRHDAGAAGFRAAHDDRRRHCRGLCGADGIGIVDRAPPDAAKALARRRGAGPARLAC